MEKHLEYLDSVDRNSNENICYCLSLVANMHAKVFASCLWWGAGTES